MLLYIQLFLQETCLNISIVTHILLIDVYDWKGRSVKEILKINFVALNILNQAQREDLHKGGSWEIHQSLIKCCICVTVHEGTPESRR